MIDLKILREEFATLHKQAGDLLTLAATDKRELSTEEQATNKQRFSRMDSIQAQVNDAQKLAQYSVTNGDAILPTTPPGKAQFDAEQAGKVAFDAAKYRAAANFYGRTGDTSRANQLISLNGEYTNFAVTSGSQSGIYVPAEVLPPVDVKRLPNAIRQVLISQGVTPITRTLTEQIKLPVQDDSGNQGQQQAEGATSGTSVDPTLTGSITLNPTLYTSKQQWLSNTVVGANDFDLFSYMLPMLQRRLDKTQEQTWIGDLKSSATNYTTASPSGITYADVLGWEHSVPAAYRSDAAFILSDSAYQQVRGLVDNNKRPIFDLDPTNVFQLRLHNKPIIVSDYLDSFAPAGTVGVFCSASAMFVFDAGYKRLARYVLQPGFPDQTGFELFANGDFDWISSGVANLKIHA